MNSKDSDRVPGPALLSRRRLLFQMAIGGAGGAAIARQAAAGTRLLAPVSVENPLSSYPNRQWEKVYRDLYHHDSTFTFLCAPNDTHNCLLRAYVKNGVVTRLGPTFGYSKAQDLDGNRSSQRWDPRCCQKGLALVRRIYGDRRIKRPMGRRGFVEWARAGFPRDEKTGAVDAKYMQRGRDGWLPLSWDEAFDLTARALKNIAETYSGDAGEKRLAAQGYDPAMIEATHGSGTQTFKFRGGMPALGLGRVMSLYRLANGLALLDAHVRKVGPDKAVGARHWDSYSWHTDLPPGHPMVTGQQTVDFDLCNFEHAGLVIVWGMNLITTKMPDAHWLTEARMKGTKVVVVACEYSATASKGDEVLIVRPGTTPALALGLAQVLISEKLYDGEYIRASTDLPFLVRMDTGELLRATDIVQNFKLPVLSNGTVTLKKGEKAPDAYRQSGTYLSQEQLEDFGAFVVWDEGRKAPVTVSRDHVGRHFIAQGVKARLEGEVEVKLTDGRMVKCRTVFDVTREVLDGSYTPEQVEKLTWAPADAIRKLARQIAANAGKTLFPMGMGPNQFFNSDLKDRAVFLIAAMTRNVGRIGGNVGSYAGNYRAGFFNGAGQYITENPFDIELDPNVPARSKKYYKGESAHFFNSGDRPLRMGKELVTGKSHMPTPTKVVMLSNSNSVIGNAKGHYELVVNTLKRVEFLAVSDWWWTASCEYADIAFGVDSWAEFKYPDMTISVTNPFLYTFPVTPLPRIHDTKSDLQVSAGISAALAKLTGESRLSDYWKFIHEGKVQPYLQRVIDHGTTTRGYRIDDLERKAEQGIPALLLTRTYPKYIGFEQSMEHRPWWTRSGRLEFYRDEKEFRDSGENLLIHREPIDSTPYEPNVIVAKAHPLLRPKGPEAYGVARSDLSTDTRQARHVIRTVEEVLASRHPLRDKGFEFVFHTPKYRHGTHTTPVDTDIVAAWFGPFGDPYRTDRRMPFVTEMYVDINPADARELGVEDGDYVYVDADPSDRPFRGWDQESNREAYKVARLLARARYYPGTPRHITRMWHNTYGATFGSVRGAQVNSTGLAKNPETGYQALYRTGSQQSCTRGWLKPTWLTDSLVVKDGSGMTMTRGFVLDVHCAVGAPRESFVRISRAEPGGEGGKGLWRPAALGLRPGYENESVKKFLAGGYVHKA